MTFATGRPSAANRARVAIQTYREESSMLDHWTGRLAVAAAALGAFALSGCTVDLAEGWYECDPNSPQTTCPSGHACQIRGSDTGYRCYATYGNYCGDGERGEREERESSPASNRPLSEVQRAYLDTLQNVLKINVDGDWDDDMIRLTFDRLERLFDRIKRG